MAYKQQCIDWGNAIRREADRFYDHQIQATKELIQKAKSDGIDPMHVTLEDGIATINYELLLHQNLDAKNQAYGEADLRAAHCDSNAVPDWLSDAQKTIDFAMTLALLPYVALTQHYAAAKVDLGEVYKGKTFGGDNALFPKAREDAFNALGIGGDAAKILRNPVHEVPNVVNDAINAIKEVLPPLPQLPPLPPLPQFPPAPKINWPKW